MNENPPDYRPGKTKATPPATELDRGIYRKLQLKKLSLEIESLQQPWWRRAEYLSAALPTFLAIGTLAIAYKTGYFDQQAKILELRKETLETQEREAKKQVEQLLVQKTAAEEALKEERQKLAALATQKEDAERRLATLERDRDALTAEAQTEKRRLDDFREEAVLIPYTTFLHHVLDGTGSGEPVQDKLIEDLRSVLAKSPQHRPRWAGQMKQAIRPGLDPTAEAAILYIQYRTLRDEAAFTKLLALARDAAGESFSHVWDKLTFGNYEPPDVERIVRLVVEVNGSGKLSVDQRSSALKALTATSLGPKASDYADKDLYFRALDISRSFVLNKVTNEDRDDVLYALSYFAPALHLYLAAVLLAEPRDGQTPDFRAELLEYMKTDNFKILAPPQGDDPKTWGDWLAGHPDFVGWCREPGFSTFRQHTGWLYEMESPETNDSAGEPSS